MSAPSANPGGAVLVYEAADGSARVDVRLDRETVWLTQDQMARLFGRERSVVTKHVRNAFREGELEARATRAKFAQVQTEGGRTVTRETFAAMVDDVAARLEAFHGRDRLDHLVAGPDFHLLGTSGTVTTLAGVHLELERYDRRRVDGLWMDRGSVDGMIEKLLGWDFQQRVANPCIGADRADLVLAGCAILEAIRGMWPSERLRVADRGLREGILSELMADDGVWRDRWRERPHTEGGRR